MQSLENNDQFASAFEHAQGKQGVFVGRSCGGLAIYWRKFVGLSCTLVFFTDRIMGLKLFYNCFLFLLLTVHSICDYRTQYCLFEYMLIMSQLANICNSESFDDICIIGDLNCNPFNGNFFDELRLLTCQTALIIPDVDTLPFKFNDFNILA